MPKQSTKRKSDDTLPAPASKLRKTMASIARGGDGSDGSEGKESSEEQKLEEDEEMTETQQLLAIVKFGSRGKREAAREATEYLKGFEQSMEKRANVMSTRVRKLENAADEKEDEFLKAFKAAYSLATPFASESTEDGSRGFAALYETNKKFTTNAHSLVEKFKQVSKRIQNLDVKKMSEYKWKDEDKSIAKLLAAGRKVGMDKYHSILHASKPQRLRTEEARAAKILYDDEDAEPSVWGKIARKQERAAKRLARAVETVGD